MADRDEREFEEGASEVEGDSASVVAGDSEEEGEDLMDNFEADYRPMEHLDRYETEGLDTAFIDDATMEARMDARAAAEAALARRDRQEGRLTGHRRGLIAALAGDESDVDDGDRPRRRRRLEEAQAGDDIEGEYEINLEETRGPIKEWIAKDNVRREIKRRFARFLRTYAQEGGDPIYPPLLRAMVRTNCQSLELDYVDLANGLPVVAVWVADMPRDILPILDETAKEVVLDEFEDFGDTHSSVYVRLANIPLEESIRDLRHFHLNSLVRVDGVVTRRTGVYPQLQRVMYDCSRCGAVLGPYIQTGDREIRLGSCPSCESKGPFSINVRETVYRNYQKITLQESPGSVPAGRLPRSKEVILLTDLVDGVRPGEEVVVTGIYQHSFEAGQNARHGFPVYSTSIEAVHLARRGELYSAARLTDEDRAEVRALARDPRIAARIVKSIAPSIYGHEGVKHGVALALFGGQEKHPSATHRLRGDINMLLLGDPGTAKSQFLKYVEKAAHRAVYTTGKGASAVGLTASVHKDAITGEWTLEGGALVLADRGVCLIDEFDKMNDADRVSIHEAMEQQSISISKAGIVTQLQARCSVLAAANPVGGRYDASKTFSENVELTDPILSRFDILCVIRDTVDAVNDERLASFVVASHARSHPDAPPEAGPEAAAGDGEVLSQEMLRKYVTYAKQTCRPRLALADHDKIAQVYADLRRESALTQGMPIAVRHLESMVRMSEARAAMHLRDHVTGDDIDAAIRVMLESFVSTQKLSVQKSLRRKFRRYIVDRADFDALILYKLQECLREARRAEAVMGTLADPAHFAVPVRQLEERCKDLDILELGPFFASSTFSGAGFSLSEDGARVLLSRV
ncbi:MCM2 [Auxenochlorella protothecoides x Auxenochlorella symbiontica]